MGGNLMYLGGNGWYSESFGIRKFPGIIEIRRAEGVALGKLKQENTITVLMVNMVVYGGA